MRIKTKFVCVLQTEILSDPTLTSRLSDTKVSVSGYNPCSCLPRTCVVWTEAFSGTDLNVCELLRVSEKASAQLTKGHIVKGSL